MEVLINNKIYNLTYKGTWHINIKIPKEDEPYFREWIKLTGKSTKKQIYTKRIFYRERYVCFYILECWPLGIDIFEESCIVHLAFDAFKRKATLLPTGEVKLHF